MSQKPTRSDDLKGCAGFVAALIGSWALVGLFILLIRSFFLN